MKKTFFLLILLIVVSGCEVKNYNVDSVDNILNLTLSDSNDLVNNSFQGYEMYIPRGISLSEKSDYNLVLTSNSGIYYLYVDAVSYYYEENVEFTSSEDSFYSNQINYGDSIGYLDVKEVDSKYFIQMMYNYAKIETYVDIDDFSVVMIEISNILKSVKYQYEILDTLIGENVLNYEEIPFDILSPKTEAVDFIEYVNEYGTYYDDGNLLPNENEIKIDENN